MNNESVSKNGKQTEPTYINLAKGFYALGFPHYITPQGVAVFHAILYRANELRFPQTIRISNTELCGNAGDLKCNSFRKVRDQLCEFEHDGKKLLSYTPEPNQRAGWYEINYKLLLSVFCDINVPNFIAEERIDDQTVTEVGLKCDQTVTTMPVFEHDPRQDKTREEKRRSSSSSKDIVVQEEDDEENISERYNEFNITKRLIETHYDKTYFLKKGLMPKKRIMMKDIGEYPEESIVSAIEKVGLGLKNPERLIQFVLDELKITQLNNEPETEQPPRVATFVKSPRERAWIELINVPDWAYMSDFVETGKIPERQFATICTVLRTFFDHLENFEGFTEDYEKKYPGNIDTMKDMLTYINRKESEGNTDDSN